MMVAGRRVDFGLGGWPVASLSMARERALENRLQVWQGIDPREAKRKALMPTFREACEGMIAANRARWRNAHTEQTITRQMERYAYPSIGRVPVDRLTQANILRVAVPVMTEKPATGKQVRQAIRGALAWAMASGYIRTNPAGEAIEAALPKGNGATDHHAAIPYREVGALLDRVDAAVRVKASLKACIRFTVLTAVRSNEARLAQWSEFDLAAGVWLIPGERMKMRRPHRVPLSREALRVLGNMRRMGGSDYVFPSPVNPGAPVGRPSMMAVLRRMGVDGTVHGMRSAFRDWCAEQTDVPREVAEAALAHVTGNETERSYARSDLFAKRAELMRQWASYVLAS